MSTKFPMFEKYQSAVRGYAGDASAPNLLMASEGSVSVYYSPFEWVNPRAKVVLVGITPGRVQAANALAEAKRCLLAGLPPSEVLSKAKQTGAFSGAMRPNLISLMDAIGLPKWLGIASCADLFGSKSELLQTASALQYPVFVDGDNYNGSPDPLKSPLLQSMLIEHFGGMALRLPDAVYIPLGPVPTKALAWLVREGQIPAGRILLGLPHPSGANAERIAYFLGRKPKSELSTKTDPTKLDAARSSLISAVEAL